MSPRSLQKAFTLTEVLMAAGILAIGFMLVATIFPVGLKLTTMATERTVAGVVLDEALAKIRIFDPNVNNLPVTNVNMVYFNIDTISPGSYSRLYTKFDLLGPGSTVAEIEADIINFLQEESLYPSADITGDKKYSWSTLLRRTSANSAQVIIFVSRRTSVSSQYHDPEIRLGNVNYGRATTGQYNDWPMPVRVHVTHPVTLDPDMLQITNSTEFSFINKGTKIVDDENGEPYTVLDRRGASGNQIELNRDWIDENGGGTSMWVIPPAVGAARSPCITVFQTTIAF